MTKLYKQTWWRKMWGAHEPEQERVDVMKNINAIRDCLNDVNTFVSKIQTQLDKVEELEKERVVTHKKELRDINIETQAKEMDTLLSAYETLQTDIDINGIRVKKIAKEFLKTATHEGHKDLVHERKKHYLWSFEW